MMIENPSLGLQIVCCDQVADVFRAILRTENEVDRDKEHFWVVGLNGRNAIKYIELVSLGIAGASMVHPRETYRMAIMQGVTSIICAHNHPCGTAVPSDADIKVTRQLKDAGEIIGIKLLDHAIVTDTGYYSFLEQGTLLG